MAFRNSEFVWQPLMYIALWHLWFSASLQAEGQASVALPNTLDFQWAHRDGAGIGDGTLGLKLEVEKLNMIIKL